MARPAQKTKASQSPAMPELKEAVVGNVPVAWRDDGGKGTPVVVFSGWGYGASMGEVAFGSLRKEGCRVITFDTPGTGSLSGKSSFVHIQRLSSAIASVLRENGIHDATIVGHSFGSMVAQEMAISEDDIAARLVLISALPGVGGWMPDLNMSLDMFNRLLSGQEGFFATLFTPGYLAQLKHTLGDIFDELDRPSSGSALSGQVWAASRWTSYGRLDRIYQPALLIHGEKDPLTPPTNARLMADQMPSGKLELLPCGYLPFLEKKEETLGMIRAFAVQKPEI